MKHNHIELFAGCGGLSLGLESEGFKLLLANEMSPMAAETFAFNHLGLNLKDDGIREKDPIYWISSTLNWTDHKGRLSEPPSLASGEGGVYSDLDDLGDDYSKLKGSLLVGSILALNQRLENNGLAKALSGGLGSGQVDLVSGGPPCQSFSMAGTRNHSDEKNSLPRAFAKFVHTVQPRMALLENVTGILRPFTVTENNKEEKKYAWHEVAIAFATEGYVPLCLHVNAKYAGAAQNRPRFIMLAFKEEEALQIIENIDRDRPFLKAMMNSYSFFDEIYNRKQEPSHKSIDVHDLNKDDPLFQSPLFEPLRKYKGNEFTVRHAIDDLNGGNKYSQEYIDLINKGLGRRFASFTGEPANMGQPENNNRVKARFRLYQVMARLNTDHRRTITKFLKEADPNKFSEAEILELAKSLDRALVDEFTKNRKKNWLLTERGELYSPASKAELVTLLTGLHTKKQTQRALIPDQPAPAALSIPDDACHYKEDPHGQRTLSVREMARFQSFPDGFEFRSKVTTGGKMREFQVPQYTQVGNAVPPLLGKALGQVCKSLLKYGEKT